MINLFEFDYVGVDLHKEKHVAVLMNSTTQKIKTIKFKNIPTAFPKFVETVYKASKTGKIIFGLEDTSFYGRSLAKYLVETGETVKEVNSALVKNLRKTMAQPNKTDEIDAHAVAKCIIFHYHELPAANPQDIYLALKNTLNARNQYSLMISNLKNMLHTHVLYHYPNYKSFFKNFDSKTAQKFFYYFPSPEMVSGMTTREIFTELKKYNKSAPWSKVEEIYTAVQELGHIKPSRYVSEENKVIRSKIKALVGFTKEMHRIEETLDNLVEESGYPLKTIPGVDTILAATFIANIGDINRFKNSAKLAKLAGIAPASSSSGKSENHFSNTLGNRDLNKAFYSLSLNHIRKGVNPIMHEYYKGKIAEGRKKKAAMVHVERRLVNIVFRIMKDKQPYIQPSEEVIKAS